MKININVSRETLNFKKNKINVSRETLDEYYMSIAYKEAKKAFKHNEIPVGCIIVKNNKIVSKAHNKKEKRKNVVAHAEILAILKANKKIRNWRLDDCIMYVTMEPCMMCCGAIEQSRIKEVVFGCKNNSFGYLLKYGKIKNRFFYTKKCKIIVQKFFKNIR